MYERHSQAKSLKLKKLAWNFNQYLLQGKQILKSEYSQINELKKQAHKKKNIGTFTWVYLSLYI